MGNVQFVSDEVMEVLKKLKRKVVIGFVGGSDLRKQNEQLGEKGESFCPTNNVRLWTLLSLNTTRSIRGVQLFDFAFSENGLNAIKKGKMLATQVKLVGNEDVFFAGY
jgi:phosphomannomutase